MIPLFYVLLAEMCLEKKKKKGTAILQNSNTFLKMYKPSITPVFFA